MDSYTAGEMGNGIVAAIKLLFFMAVGSVILAFVFGFMLLADITNSGQELIDECEKTLARDKHCVLIAVPALEGGDE